MLKKDYLSRLSRAARWRLGAKEAEEVIADYREMIGNPPRLDEELVRELGKPKDAIKPLTERKTYYTWLAVFLILAACIWLPGTSALPLADYRIFAYCFSWLKLGRVVALLGAAGAIVWFRWKGHKAKQLPKALPVLLMVLLVWLLVHFAVTWAWMHDPYGFTEMWGQMPLYVLWVRIGPAGYTVSRSMNILTNTLEWGGGLGMAVVGIIALIKARMSDRRWASVYVLAMAAMLVSLEALSLLTWMDYDVIPTWESYFSSCFCTYIMFTAVGLLGTGVALC